MILGAVGVLEAATEVDSANDDAVRKRALIREAGAVRHPRVNPLRLVLLIST